MRSVTWMPNPSPWRSSLHTNCARSNCLRRVITTTVCISVVLWSRDTFVDSTASQAEDRGVESWLAPLSFWNLPWTFRWKKISWEIQLLQSNVQQCLCLAVGLVANYYNYVYFKRTICKRVRPRELPTYPGYLCQQLTAHIHTTTRMGLVKNLWVAVQLQPCPLPPGAWLVQFLS